MVYNSQRGRGFNDIFGTLNRTFKPKKQTGAGKKRKQKGSGKKTGKKRKSRKQTGDGLWSGIKEIFE